MRIIKILSLVVALHLIGLAFLFYKPPLNYFAVSCLSTILVWAAVFKCRRRLRAAITAGALLQLAIQQVTYHIWVAPQISIWWPLLQFLSLQYVVALRLGSSRENTTGLGGH